jgi:hypothetical protein
MGSSVHFFSRPSASPQPPWGWDAVHGVVRGFRRRPFQLGRRSPGGRRPWAVATDCGTGRIKQPGRHISAFAGTGGLPREPSCGDDKAGAASRLQAGDAACAKKDLGHARDRDVNRQFQFPMYIDFQVLVNKNLQRKICGGLDRLQSRRLKYH